MFNTPICMYYFVKSYKGQCSHATWKTLKTWNFFIYFSRPGKCLEFAQKLWKTWNFNSKPGKKNLYFANFVFQDWLFKMSFSKKIWYTSLSYLHYQHKHWFKAKLTCDFIAFTWKIHGIFCHQTRGNPGCVIVCLIWKINGHLF